ncbi:MAG: 50S ribosomal protein L4 [Actinomycetota bacterium]
MALDSPAATLRARSFAADGSSHDEVELPPSIFGVKVNVPAMHQVVTAQLAAIRAGTHSTKTRAEVRGGGRKPWRQKGTGRARHGSIREPQWVGGGVAHGPKPRDHAVRVNKKTRALALRSALSDQASTGAVVVADLPALDQPQTKRAVELLERWGAAGLRTLLVLDRGENLRRINVTKSFRNLPMVVIVTAPTTYLVLEADIVVFTPAAFDALTAPKAMSHEGGGE